MKYKIVGSWISILAILVVSLMPVISQAFEHKNLDGYEVICSSNGLKIILESSENKNDAKDKSTISHCNYCSFVIDDQAISDKERSLQNLLSLLNVNVTHFDLSIKDHPFLSGNSPQAPPSI